MKTKLTLGLTLLALSATLIPAANGQERRPGPFSQMVNVPALVDNYARFLARKYELSPEQEEKTVILLQQKTDNFLSDHEDTIFELYQSMLAVRGGGDMSQDELVDWGKVAMPIYNDAKELIIGGNAEWRDMLTDEQKKMHDADVELMYESFQTTDDQLNRIVTGDMTVEEFRNPPKMNRRRGRSNRARQTAVARSQGREVSQNQINRGAQPTRSAAAVEDAEELPEERSDKERLRDHRKRQPTVARNNDGDSDAEQAEVAEASGNQDRGNRSRNNRNKNRRSNRGSRNVKAGENFESAWEKYVRDFIAKYELDDGQKGVAEKILGDCQEQATRYMTTRKSQIDKIDSLLKDAKGDKQKSAAALQTKKKKLLAPIDQIFERQLKPRLEKIPTRAQRAAANAPKSKKK